MNSVITSSCNYKDTYYPYIAILFLIVLLWTYFRYFKRTLLSNIALIIIVIGGLLNILEWLFKGCVLDYIRFFNISLYNINDLLIMLGLGILLFKVLYERI